MTRGSEKESYSEEFEVLLDGHVFLVRRAATNKQQTAIIATAAWQVCDLDPPLASQME